MFVLVTGGAGFIGSNIVKFLLESNHKVRVLDNLSTGFNHNIQEFTSNPNFEFILGDITDLNTVLNSLADIDVICHQAALGSVPRSISDPLSSHNANVNGFLNVLMAAKEKGIKRIVYASSSSVYGDHPGLPKVEDQIGKALSPYAITKYIDELYAELFTKLYGLECIGLRYFNVFGPKQNPNGAYAAVIPKFVSDIKNNIRPTINGDGSFSRDFTFVDNVVQANYLALHTTNTNCFGQAFNIGCGGQITINEIFYTIRNGLRSKLEPIYGPERKGDVAHSNADITKAKEFFEYNPEISFKDGIIRTLEFYTK